MLFDSEPAAEVTARDRVLRLRDFMAELPAQKINMWIPHDDDCATPVCVCGWARRIFHGGKCVGREVVARDLGFSDQNAANLMLMQFGQANPERPARAQPSGAHIAIVLDHYLETGKIDWSVAE